MPVSKEKYIENKLFPFFDGLIPEGWLLDIATKNWKINANDRMGLLLSCCRSCIGAVSVEPINEQS
jgi:serine/threonine-protein kinase HipA